MKKKLIYLTAAMFIMTILANMGHPVTPELVVRLNMSSFMYGLMFAAMSTASFLMSPVWGSLSDKYKSRKLFMYLPAAGYGLAQLGFGFSTSPAMIIIFRILGGVFSSSVFTIAIAYIVDETESVNRNKAISYYTAITGFGMSLGYLVGGYIGANDYHYAFIFQAAGLILHAAIIRFFLPESDIKAEDNNKPQKHFIYHLKDDFIKYMPTSLGTLLIVVLLTSFSSTAYSTGINYFLKKYLYLNPLQIGYYMAITGIIGIIANVYFTPKVSQKYGDKRALKYVLLATGITLLVLSIINNLFSPLAILIFILFILVFSMFNPLLQTMVSNHSKNEHGKIMGFQNSASSFGMVAGSLFSGALLDSHPKFSFLIAAIFFSVSYLIIKASRKLR